MINITDKHKCCGCGACVQRCPQRCISLRTDEEGFSYPYVELSACIKCGLCERVCMFSNKSERRNQISCYAAINTDDGVRDESSSGGAFSALAEYVIDQGGIVFGAKYDSNWEVVHSSTENINGLSSFRGSKYVQSRIGDSYSQTEKYLKQGRMVLFSGTSCQIVGLKLFLMKDYQNLITAEIICHGVPSPKLWSEYTKYLPICQAEQINMKDKSSGWSRYSFSIYGVNQNILLREAAASNKWLTPFAQNLTLRPSCYHCPAKLANSKSDFTLGDCWGINDFLPEFYDDKGCSLVICNTTKAEELISKSKLLLTPISIDDAVRYNPSIIKSVTEPYERTFFWKEYFKNGIEAILSPKPTPNPSFVSRTIRFIKRKLDKS